MRAYEYRHVVGFEETSLAGNVYFVNHLRWQGRCRELFLQEHAPDVLALLSEGLALITARCSCDYLAELTAFDQLSIRMRLGQLGANRIVLLFDYFRQKNGEEELVARGEQQIVSMERVEGRMVPTPLPASLRDALRPYQQGG